MKLPVVSSHKRENYAKVYMIMIAILGWAAVVYAIFHLEPTDDITILLLLTAFLVITEYYPIPLLRGSTSITFPFIFVMYELFGVSYPIMIYAVIAIVINILHQRPLRIVLFNPAQLAASVFLSEYILSHTNVVQVLSSSSDFLSGLSTYILFLALFFIINNFIVDIVLLIRPQPYTFYLFKMKTLIELGNVGVSLLYGAMMFYLGGRKVDEFSLFFFFSPLVAISLLYSVISTLKNEKKRLNALFAITTGVNKKIHSAEWIDTFKNTFSQIVDVQALMLWVKENDVWKILYYDGRVTPKDELTGEALARFDGKKQPIVYQDRVKKLGPIDEFFKKDMKAFVYSPMVVEDETIGMLVVAKSRARSFEEDEIHSIATLSNQLAVAVKTRMLIEEKEKRIILEERNRIARGIHDGVAQTLAGAVMKLETAERKFDRYPDETRKLIRESMDKLRLSLREVRESIYELRPYPTERVSLSVAIGKRIDMVKSEYDIKFSFDIRGQEVPLSPMVEKELFDIFQESLQNTIKHAQATKIEVLLSYQKEHIILKIKDNGVGFSLFQAMVKAQNNPHFGILNMNDAAEKINATLQIDTKEEHGTDITLTVPKMGLEGGNLS
ncbi:GAF domain-containing sensor histidine kinase [Bacillus sp. REN16]|uniref:GAF domain-containing sensor histidine kinase n=1 Tax=Bacillus sp. REN16 TaxID=2887296 RepID=UPI001E637553|nr:GAF domain-containing sensor histidine kinase [Bacillus sp. REN16]MCC3356171.1 GAF domain-containing sensor histidine kinase [Bacillus sp. REN16]